jgi:hypothetical protein
MENISIFLCAQNVLKAWHLHAMEKIKVVEYGRSSFMTYMM